MIAPFLERAFGANWRTSLSGVLSTAMAIVTAAAILPRDTWTDWRVYVPAVLAILAKTTTDFTTKDARVTGGSVQQGSLHGATREAGKPEDILP